MKNNFSTHQGGGVTSPQNQIMERTNIGEVSRLNGGINELPFEVLFLIFQCTIDVESADMRKSFPSYPPEYTCVPTPADRLVSVCKYWKAIVYDSVCTSESLWSVLWLDFRRSFLEIEYEEDRVLALRSEPTRAATRPQTQMPLDLFLSHIDTPFELSLDFERSGVTHAKVLRSIDVAISSHAVRHLSIHCSTKDSYHPQTIPFHFTDLRIPLTNLKYLHLEWHRVRQWTSGIGNLIHLVPHLEELRLVGWQSAYSINNKDPSLPRLRRLELSPLGPCRPFGAISSGNLIALLRRTPNIEYLRLTGDNSSGNASSYPYQPIPDHAVILPHLRKICLHQNRRFHPHPFSEGWIEAPVLSEVSIERTNGPNKRTMLRWRQFFTRNQAITKISLPVKSGYTMFLSEAPSIEYLTLDATKSTGEGWLRHLGDKDTKSLVSGERLPICPNLRELTLILGSTIPFMSTFGTFIRARCLPIDAEGNSAAGYRVLAQVILRFPDECASAMDSMAKHIRSGAWGNVEMERGEDYGRREFRLRWRSSKPECHS